MIVADTNTIAYLYLPSDYSDDVEAVLLKDPQWIAPFLWRSELRNILTLYLRKKLITMSDAADIQQQAEALLIDNEYQVSSLEVLQTAHEFGCSAYDAEFIVLARDTNCQLVTADKKILKAFPEIATSARNFVASGF
ncbi:MAG: VapC toxin family PIN domain ribonuclease [unclassified Hahellaceae]|nr:VapC toxin family PIN domain ribonuclease [Hahellaceae bacterium]|tara:strand:- start:9294 stop:9704 length:411 start_codon:yes stop_codon:yes gene_type:complete